jgi:hypothetical protein
MGRCFGTADAYSHNLRLLGHEATEVVANCVPMQCRWAADHGLRSLARLIEPLPARTGRAVARLTSVFHKVVVAQIAAYEPDVVYVQDVRIFTARQVRQLRKRGRLTVGQLGSKPPPLDHLRAFDLITTSLPNHVSRFRDGQVATEYFRLGFDERVLDRLRSGGPIPRGDVVFVGGLNPMIHAEGVRLLEHAVRALDADVAIYGYGAEKLSKDSPIRDRYGGEAWGLDMYRVQAGARIALNRHVSSLTEGHANNMRLYEATGVGAALLTDAALNLADLFAPEVEVATYRDADGLVKAAQDLLDDERRRAALAAAGQARTLSCHTFAHRLTELVGILEHYLSVRQRTSDQTAQRSVHLNRTL